jgi:hypothetical protein
MPEGPEVYILYLALKKFGINCKSYGKHLYISNINEDWSFGLNGKVKIDEKGNLNKIDKGFIIGEKIKTDIFPFYKLGIDLMSSSLNDFEQIINNWKTSTKSLGSLLLDQSQISGIGVAWASEILHKCNLRPDLCANKQNLSNLSITIEEIRNYSKELYENYLSSQTDIVKFINSWFKNLYIERKMNIYKKGIQIKVSGRIFWV